MRVRKQRTGITLLFVVSLIVLFMLLATTFLVVSSQYLRGAKSYSQGEVFSEDPVNELDQAFYVLLRDTTDPDNPVRGHSLLADIYGVTRGFGGTITGVGDSANEPNELVKNLDVASVDPAGTLDFNQKMGRFHNLLVGRFLTITSGKAKGLTGRIIANTVEFDGGAGGGGPIGGGAGGNPTNRISVLFDRSSFDRDPGSQTVNLNSALADVQLNGVEFWVNGPAFQGKGAGFNGTTDPTQAAYSAEALSPNQEGTPTLENYLSQGDLNETWDAPDYQNVWLSAQESGIDANGQYVSFDLPSFYRPRLPSDAGGFRADLPSPLGPDIQGSPFQEFDVDNDGDLRKDSIWVDFNLPVMADDTGRTYKRLFAVMVRDMGGRLNLNAHSNRFHLDFQEWTAEMPYVADEIAAPTAWPVQARSTGFSEDGQVLAFPQGQGWGPPEINLRTVFSNDDLKRLFSAGVIDGFPAYYGRNGVDGQPGI
ncbi:MAG: hypothetical protein VX438_01155, partial [Planctomycetota bacterium]|nr:hypothetical protein [Planctomycetota bacterium]